MPKTTKVAISLPQGVLAAADREVAARGTNRSQLISLAIAHFLKHEGAKLESEQYMRGYIEQPEAEDDFPGLDHLASKALADEPWE